MTRAGDRRLKLGLGLGAGGLVAAFIGGAFALLLLLSGSAPDLVSVAADPYLRGVVLFTLEQAALSTALSLAGAVPLAVALHRTRFRGRSAILRLFLLPQALPVIVGGLAILAVWGRNGIIADLSVALGLPRFSIYGLPGILIAHVFFNLPLAARLILAALDAVPAESWKLAGQLSLSPWTVFRVIEWPAVRTALPGAASLVFMLCVTSFTLVLVLGGGPGATTLEVAIYQSLRYDFDPGRAVVLSLGQILLTALVLLAALRLGGDIAGGFTLGRPAQRQDRGSFLSRVLDTALIALGIGFVASPFAAILADGLAADLGALLRDPAVHRAALTSAVIAFAAASLSLALSLCLALAAEASRSRGYRTGRWSFDLTASLVLVVPPVVVGAGWFLALREVTDVFATAPYVVVATNAVMAMPFIVRIVGPALAASGARHDRLADSLGLYGLPRFRLVEWPAIRGPLGLAFAFALAISVGDLGAIALFGSQDLVTLPYLLMQRMGSYRSTDAAGLALFLGALCLGLMILAERGLARAGVAR